MIIREFFVLILVWSCGVSSSHTRTITDKIEVGGIVSYIRYSNDLKNNDGKIEVIFINNSDSDYTLSSNVYNEDILNVTFSPDPRKVSDVNHLPHKLDMYKSILKMNDTIIFSYDYLHLYSLTKDRYELNIQYKNPYQEEDHPQSMYNYPKIILKR